MFLKLTIILLFVSSATFAQHLIARDLKDYMFIKVSKQGEQNREDIEGSPLLNETFVTGEVITFNTKFTGVPLRYNIFDDNIEFKHDNALFTLVPEHRIKQVHIGNDIFVAEEHEFKGRLKFGFLTLLDTGKVILMAKKIVNFTPKKEPDALDPKITPAKFTRGQDMYFYKIGKAQVVKIDNLKKLIESLPGKQEELSQYAKREKISVKKEDELIKLVRYYNSL